MLKHHKKISIMTVLGGGGGGSKVGRFRTFPKIEFGLKNINHDSIGGGFSKMF